METRRMWPEVLISGFIWLLVVMSLAGWWLTVDEIVCWLGSISQLETSLLTLFSGLVIAASYFFGALAHRLLSSVFGFLEPRWNKYKRSPIILFQSLFERLKKGNDSKGLCEVMAGTEEWQRVTFEDRYGVKLMFRSVSVGMLCLYLSNLCRICSLEQRTAWAISILFISLVVLSGCAFWLQRESHKEFEQELKNRPKNKKVRRTRDR